MKRSRARVSFWAAATFLIVFGSVPNGGLPETKTPLTEPQPIPFSHKLHAKFVTGCQFCHESANSGMDMTFPTAAKCMVCHASIATRNSPIVKLAQYQKENRPIPWVQVYAVPDYVLFSHAVHEQGKISCAACHGPVEQRDVVVKEQPTSMKFCVDCHVRTRAPVACNTCHDPNP